MARVSRQRLTWTAGLLVALLAPGAGAEVSLSGWYFPKPFTLESPMSAHRFGGMDLGFVFSDLGLGIAMPLSSTMTDREMNFAVDIDMPLAIGVPKVGGTDFYGGNPTLGVRGMWRFVFPFAEGFKLPAAWGAGIDVGIPLAMAWGANSGFALAYPMYVQDVVSWYPDFGFRPKATFAIGQPIFFLETTLGLPSLIDDHQNYFLLLDWGAALGSQPHELVSISLEFGGVHWLASSAGSVDANHVWGALGARLYLKQFTTGLMLRLPFTDDLGEAEATFSFLVFVGYELRLAKDF